jgi:8-oxo-dGTP diphosphatase
MEKPFKLSVRAVILDENGRCLLLKRSRGSKTNPGKWELPGGKVDDGEQFEQALLREIAEETRLNVTLRHPSGVAESDLPSVMVVHLIMEGVLEAGQVILSGEHDDYVWVDPKEMPKMDLADYMRVFAHEYAQRTRTMR